MSSKESSVSVEKHLVKYFMEYLMEYLGAGKDYRLADLKKIINEETCLWMELSLLDYETGCGSNFTISVENTSLDYEYCPSCGKRILFEEK